MEVFHEWLYIRLPGIKFTKHFSSHGIEFLNSFVYCGQDNKLQTKPYSKACDEHTYLVPTSCHPVHNIRNIPYSIGHTIYRIASEKHEYDLSKANYTDYLPARGYSSEVIRESFKKLETNDRMSYLEPKVKPSTNERVFPLVADFNPGLPNIGGILNEHRHILFLDKELCKVINPSKNFASYRGAKTLEDSLIHSKLPSLNDNFNKNQSTLNQSGGCQPCEKRCVLCKNYLLKTDKAYSHQTNTKYKIKDM